MCGGTPGFRMAAAMRAGLSPRVRGNPDGSKYRQHLLGSIPACAGEPRKSRRTRTPKTVYPRVCGGTPLTASTPPALLGLSPRVRGNLYRDLLAEA